MQTYSIREMSEMFSIPASTLRYYESEGLLLHIEKNNSNQRIYTQEHINRLKTINCFKRTGMTISQLKKFFEYETDEARYINDIVSLLESQEEELNEKLAQLQKDSRHVHRKVQHYKAIRKALRDGTALPEWVECEDE